MQKLLKLFLAASIAVQIPVFGTAGEVDMLVEKLAEKGVITYGEAQQIMTETKEAVRSELASGKSLNVPSWTQKISIKGDLRLRSQADWTASKSYPRIRQRIRLRVGFESAMSEKMQAGFGLATGGEKLSDKSVTGTAAGTSVSGNVSGDSIIDSEPTSTNHTLSNGFGKARLMVDYAYLKYLPFSSVTLTAGKMKAATHVWNTTDLLWDGDVNPDGVAMNFSKNLSDDFSFFANASWLVFNEKNSTANQADAYIAQPGFSWKAAKNVKIKGAVAMQTFNVNGKDTGYYGTPAFDYVCTNPSIDLSFANLVGSYTLGLFGDSVTNGDSAPASDTGGSAYGAKFGHAKVSGFGTWEVKYIQRRLEANSWLNKLGDSDAYGGALNTSGSEIALTMGLTKAASLGIDYYSMDLINNATTTTPKSLVQFDVVYKF